MMYYVPEDVHSKQRGIFTWALEASIYTDFNRRLEV